MSHSKTNPVIPGDAERIASGGKGRFIIYTYWGWADQLWSIRVQLRGEASKLVSEERQAVSVHTNHFQRCQG